MKPNSALGQIAMQIMWNRLLAVVEEQAQTLIRTSFSTTVRESGDLSAGVFDPQGRMLAQAITGTPGHVNSMANAVVHFLKEVPIETMQEGDSYASNDPWIGSGHLHDITVVTPTFKDGKAIGLFASTIHLADVGGRGMGPDAGSVYEEGVWLPIIKLVDRGTFDPVLMKIIRANSREPLQVEGDLFSAVAAGEEGGRRLVEMMNEFRIDSLDHLGQHIIENSREAILAEIRKLPRGTYRHAMTIDGVGDPVTANATMTIGENGIHVDYTGSSPVSPLGINVVLNYTLAYSTFGIRCLIGNDIPNNYGSMLPITVSAPEDTIFNAQPPAPVTARHTVGHMLPDVMLGCLHQALEGGAPAEGSMSWNPQLYGARWHDDAPRIWELYAFNAGGMGGRPNKDGLSATCFPAGVSASPTEAIEAISPAIVWRKELRTDSAGAGRHRGGYGQIVEFGVTNGAEFGVRAMFDRVQHPARGRDGGKPGAAGVVALVSGPRLNAKGSQPIPAGDLLHLEMPGGGGFGDPLAREPELVAEEVADGLLSPGKALADYAVVVSADGVLDRDATARARAAARDAAD